MNVPTPTDPVERALRADAAPGDEELRALSARLAERAGEDGLLDVAYATAESPVGPLLVAATPRGLVRVAFPGERPDRILSELSREVSPRVLESPARLDEVRRELDEYFERRRERFDVPVDWQLSRGFRNRALKELARIPYGRTITYSELAARAGNPRAQRAAGSACGANPIPIVVPCHRVVRTGGAIGNYGGGPEVKEFLLGLEGALGQLSTE
jgi:methylated-DNA-[protein]-cysteine S-methyltransferase